MNLFDRLRKPEQRTVASAIPPISLFEKRNQAEIPVQNSKIAEKNVAKSTYPNPEDVDLLSRFRLDLCEDDPDPKEIVQLNDITFHLVTVYGWQFEEAIAAAAIWGAHNTRYPEEAHFIGVMSLAAHVSRGGQ